MSDDTVSGVERSISEADVRRHRPSLQIEQEVEPSVGGPRRRRRGKRRRSRLKTTESDHNGSPGRDISDEAKPDDGDGGGIAPHVDILV